MTLSRWLVCISLSLTLVACSSQPGTGVSHFAPTATFVPSATLVSSQDNAEQALPRTQCPTTMRIQGEEAEPGRIKEVHPEPAEGVTAVSEKALEPTQTRTLERATATLTPAPMVSATETSPTTTPVYPTTSVVTLLPTPVPSTFTSTTPSATPFPPTVTPAPPSATPLSPTPTTLPAEPLPPPPVRPSAPWVYDTKVTIPTYGYELGFQATQPEDPVFPYPRLDFSQVGPPTPRTYQAVVLENGYVSLTILPELGGRIYRWTDKATGRQLLYQNPVVKPTSWGYRGWWLAAGGIEWAFPVEEHGLNEWRPWSYSTGYTAHGLSVTVSDVEDRTGMEVGVTISLDTDHAYVTLQPWARNNTAEAHTYQLWLNAMLTLGGNQVSGQTQFVVPATQVTVHSTGDGGLPGPGGAMSWPVHVGRDMSWYSNWGGYLGFFASSPSAGFVGLYDHNAEQGIVRVFATGWPAGTKFFGPAGLSPSLWTDDGSNYVELWSGATGSFWNYATLNPGQSVGWTERWYPTSGLGGFNYANESAVLRLTDTGGGAEIGVAVTVLTTGRVTLWAGGQLVGNWPMTLYPGQAFRASWVRPEGVNGALGLRLENSSGAVLAQTGLIP